MKIKDLPKVDRPREKFLREGASAVSKGDLLAIVLGTGIKGKNVQVLAKQIIQKFGENFLNITLEDLRKISGIGQAKALQIVAAISLVKRFYESERMKNQNALPFQPHLKDGIKGMCFQLQNRRYIGSKYKLLDWIFSIIAQECKGDSFTDIFAGTGVVSAFAATHFPRIILNDFLHSNYAVYRAFFGKDEWNAEKISTAIKTYNLLNGKDLKENYFSKNFGRRYFSNNSAKVIGFVREDVEKSKSNFTEREYYILLASLLYAIDKIANTVGHYDAYFKKDFMDDNFAMRLISPVESSDVAIFREDANLLVKRIKTDIVYIDPPYNSRQYSRFYHLLETLTKWDMPKLHGVALKPEAENMSDYCRSNARNRLKELVRDIDARYLVVSYNNTYDSKSNSSQNKITLEDIEDILNSRGKTKIFEKDHRYFNAGNTDFDNHKEYLFVTKANV